MSTEAIRVEQVGKEYFIGRALTQDATLIQSSLRALSGPVRRAASVLRGDSSGASELSESFWAVRNVSFEVQEGEVVGIIGRNGAGKSTLLKMLSRITYPTEGRIALHGRIGSLLEVGTGFHPELTGRENVFLNGAILGMSHTEISRKFDEIVDFSGVSQFIDTPVKHYSSGMSVRLAFAVAAHLEPEILIVDEVLSVGDAEFQRKCLGKMDSVAREGRTVLVVSHNMTAIRNLCQRVIWMNNGQMRMDGETSQVIDTYLREFLAFTANGDVDLSNWPERYGDGRAKILSARLLNAEGEVCSEFPSGSPFSVEFCFESQVDDMLNLTVAILSATTGSKIVHLSHFDTPGVTTEGLSGMHRVRFDVPALPLNRGQFEITLGIHTEHFMPIDAVRHVLNFSVTKSANDPRPFDTFAEQSGFITLASVCSINPA